MHSQTQFVPRKFLIIFNYIILACILFFLTPFFTFSYFTYFYFFFLCILMKTFLSSLLSLIMTEVRSKRRALLPLVLTSNCLKKTFTYKDLYIHESFIQLGGERHCESNVSCTRTQHNVPGQDSDPRPLDLDTSALTMRPPRLPQVQSK